jgi:hypothetical protein
MNPGSLNLTPETIQTDRRFAIFSQSAGLLGAHDAIGTAVQELVSTMKAGTRDAALYERRNEGWRVI